MGKFRKKPVIIEAVKWTGTNLKEITEFMGPIDDQIWEHEKILKIFTKEGVLEATVGDMIIKGVADEFYPCKPDIFAATYEPV